VRGPILAIDPCIPRAWTGFEFTYRYGASRYRIAIENPQGVSRGVKHATLDGQVMGVSPCQVALVDDGSYHYGLIILG